MLEAGPETLTDMLCDVLEDDLCTALDTVTVDGRNLPPLQRASLVRFLRSFFVSFGYSPPPLGASVPLPAPKALATPLVAAVTCPPAQAEVVEVLVPQAEFVDQAARGHAKPLTYAELALAGKTYVEASGCDPCEEHTPTEEQRAGLRALIRANRVPFVDFAVWIPFGSRLSRFRKTEASVFVAGTLVQKRIDGPVSVEAWSASYDLFAVAMVSLGAAKLGTMAKYKAGIAQLTRLFPRLWSVLHTSEIMVRPERWSRMREQLQRMVAMGSVAPGYDARRPWDSVIAASLYAGPLGLNASWWQAHFVLPCTLASTSADAFSLIRDVEGSTHGFMPTSSGGGGNANPNPEAKPQTPKVQPDNRGGDPPETTTSATSEGTCPYNQLHVWNVCGFPHTAIDHHTGKKTWNPTRGREIERRGAVQRQRLQRQRRAAAPAQL